MPVKILDLCMRMKVGAGARNTWGVSHRRAHSTVGEAFGGKGCHSVPSIMVFFPVY